MPGTAQQPDDERPPPTSMAGLFDEIMYRNGYANLHQLAEHTTISYKTLWSWRDGSRSAKRPPSPVVLRRFASEMRVPEAMVFRAAGRAYTDPGPLDEEALELVNHYKALPPVDQKRLLRVTAIFSGMTGEQRSITESVVRGIVSAGH